MSEKHLSGKVLIIIVQHYWFSYSWGIILARATPFKTDGKKIDSTVDSETEWWVIQLI